ncbi:MAG: acyltransferase [Gammaproteobacteria bacterium]|jgi:acetyltransferase-like isoleucine patch superfamily enzyme|uniref:acyltransferase n=1 Tax=Pseudomonas urmiensis TaxID=2745493 RepID=UPI0034D4DF98
MRAKNLICSLVCLVLPPSRVKVAVLRLLGWNIEGTCRIGFSWINCGRVDILRGARIGHFNFIACRSLQLKAEAYIQNGNVIKGPIIISLRERAAIGNFNKIKRAAPGIVWGRAIFRLGVYSKITSNHVIDCTRSVKFGDYSTLAGLSSQLWTHGYVHAAEGLDRFRVDGAITIGSNVYIGSACVINAAVRIADGVTVGAATCVAKSLLKRGLYVGQGLRWIESDYDTAKARYSELRIKGLIEAVHLKRPEQ